MRVEVWVAGWVGSKCVTSVKPPKSSVWLAQKIKERGSVLCAVRLLAAALAGIRHRFFGRFQEAPKQTRMALLTGRKTSVSARSIIHSTVLHKMAGSVHIFLSS